MASLIINLGDERNRGCGECCVWRVWGQCACERDLDRQPPKFGSVSSAISKFPWRPLSHSLMKFFISHLFYYIRTWGSGRRIHLPKVTSLEQGINLRSVGHQSQCYSAVQLCSPWGQMAGGWGDEGILYSRSPGHHLMAVSVGLCTTNSWVAAS